MERFSKILSDISVHNSPYRTTRTPARSKKNCPYRGCRKHEVETRREYHPTLVVSMWDKSIPNCLRARSQSRNSNFSHKFQNPRMKGVKTALIASIIFIILSNQYQVTQAAVPRVPYFYDIEQTFEKSKCEIREEIFDVRKFHPTLPSDAVYIPSCVALNRCSGCCQSEDLICVPTSIYVTRMSIYQQMLDDVMPGEIILEFTHHDSCACISPDNPIPICIQSQCDETERWDAESCSCVAAANVDVKCAMRTCAEDERWNNEECTCEPICPPRICAQNENWNGTLCMCVAYQHLCPQRMCPYGQVWDAASCNCELKCPVQTCGAGKFWNPNTCRCQCRRCHPNRLFHVRFNQNLQTCQCSCRAEQHGRAACKRKRAFFNPNTCQCEHSYAKHHKGDRKG